MYSKIFQKNAFVRKLFFIGTTRVGLFLAQIRVKNVCSKMFFKKFRKIFFQNNFKNLFKIISKKFLKILISKKYYFKKISKKVFCSTKSIFQSRYFNKNSKKHFSVIKSQNFLPKPIFFHKNFEFF